MKSTVARICLLTLIAMAGFAQPPAPQPGSIDDHPPAGHPVVPKPGADWPKAKAEDVGTVEAIVAAYYASTSGTVGKPRDWDRFRSLFHPQARLIPARPTGDGGAGAFFLGVNDYVEQNQKYFEKSGFIDSEAVHCVEAFGNIAQVWSTYESRRAASDAGPYARGIASIQLLKDNGRWWIITIFWDFERENNMVPQKYLSTPNN